MRATVLKTAIVVAFIFAASATAQNTAYVPFVVNADATVTARQDETVVSMSVEANKEKTLAIPLGGTTSVWNTGGTQGRLNAPLITSSRGNILLSLPAQSYQNAEIAMYSVNGRQILRGKASSTETASGISRRNVAPGAYLLSVKGTNGNAVTTRLTHSGGDMNMSVAFGTENVSPERRLGKKNAADDGDWEITIAADGYIAQTYALRPVAGINNRQIINLNPAPPQAQTYTLTIAATAGGSVSPFVGAHTYDAGALVAVTATANSGYKFMNWSGASTSASATVNITMDGNKILTANFQQNIYTLTIAATVGGSVSPSVGAHTYDAGVFVTVTANADYGYTFKNWSGASTSTSATVNITMDGNKTLTANFQRGGTPTPTITAFVDSRDGKAYKKIVIGTQTWMGENLNYDVPNVAYDVCYENSADSCAKYGRLYTWATAMGISELYNTIRWEGSYVKRQGVCPVGWHLPSDAEWTTLMDYVGGTSKAGTKLKSSTGWNSYKNIPIGTDEYGFSALPGGGGFANNFYHAGTYAYWWSGEENSDYRTSARYMYYARETVDWGDSDKRDLRSVRCVED